MFDTAKSLIIHSQKIEDAGHILDILAIEDDIHYLLATTKGIFKINQDFQLLNRYYVGELISWLSHLNDSLYLVRVHDKKELVVWDERTDTQLVSIFNDIHVVSIKRLGTTCNFITKSARDEVSVVTIKDIQKAEQISIRHLVEGNKGHNDYLRDLHL